MMKRWIIGLVIRWVERRGYMVLTPTAKKSVYFNQEGERFGVFKR